MPDSNDRTLHHAIATITQSDPLIKLLQQVAMGKMKPTDAGLRAVTESWLNTYQAVIETTPFSRQSLLRLDPRPRIDVLVQAGIIDLSHVAGQSLRHSFERILAQAESD